MPSEVGQTAIAVLVGEDDGFMVFVAVCVGVVDAMVAVLLLANGAQADNSSTIARTGSKRRGTSIGYSYLS